MQYVIELFVMEGCHFCPQMERVFNELHQKGAISELIVVDVGDTPDLAHQYNIRSVPHYLINGIGYSGFKSKQEILQLLNSDSDQILTWIRERLSDGQLSEVETLVMQKSAARIAMMDLLEDSKTELVVRIGLTAIMESLSDSRIFDSYLEQIIKLTDHSEERIAIDAVYYLHLISTPLALKKLAEIATSGRPSLKEQAKELLQESLQDAVLH